MVTADQQSPPDEQALDLSPLRHILEEFRGARGAVIPILQRTQDVYGYLPRPVLKEISRRAHIPLNQLYGSGDLLRTVPFGAPWPAPRAHLRWHRLSRTRGRTERGSRLRSAIGRAGRNIERLSLHRGDRLLPGFMRLGAGGRGRRQGQWPAQSRRSGETASGTAIAAHPFTDAQRRAKCLP